MRGELRELYAVEPYMRDRFCKTMPELEPRKLRSIGLIRVLEGEIVAGMELNIGGHRVAVFSVGNGDLVMENSQDIKSILCDLDVGLRGALVNGRGAGRIGATVKTWVQGAPTFIQLNAGWNVDPNAPEPEIVERGECVELWVWPNLFVFPEFQGKGRIRVVFQEAAKYRTTAVNDHGWFEGQCRFSGIAPKWGEFYEITGDTRDDEDKTPWVDCVDSVKQGVPSSATIGERHFHFYLSDEAFECKAQEWRVMLPDGCGAKMETGAYKI